jgi:DNA-binding MarR family transcriptional regulator
VTAERPDACRVAAWAALLDAHSRLTGRLEDELERRHGITLAQYEVLHLLRHAPDERVRLNVLAPHARMTKSGVSRLVDRMEAAGLLRTERCPSDRRGAFAVLTADGRALFDCASTEHLRRIQDHFGRHLDDDEAAALRIALERVRDSLPPAGSRAGTGLAEDPVSA